MEVIVVPEVINDRYKINRELGRGGMAVVYEATDLLLDRRVALKMLKEEYASDEDFIRKIKLEARAVARISHPNVVNIYDISLDDDNYYLVMENIAGENLKDIISSREKIPVIEALDIAAQICSALMVAHRNNIVHCDIKPHNIIVTPQNQVKVTDFGIARAVSSSSKLDITTSVEGSAYYFSPEQARGAEITPLCDIYSLGVVLYEMLTGQLPFTGKTAVNVALKHINEKPERVRLREEGVPEEVQELVMKALAKRPEDRFQGALAMRNAIKNALAAAREKKRSKEEEDLEEFSGEDLDKTIIHSRSPGEMLERMEEQDSRGSQAEDAEVSEVSAHEKEENQTGQALKQQARLIFTAVLIILGLLVVAYFSYTIFMDVPVVEVPEVVGYDLEEAESILQQEGLNYAVAEDRINHPELEENKVANQSPAAGEEIRQTREITLVISAGPEYVEIPELEYMTLREARIALESRGLSVGEEKYDFSSEHRQDIVISSEPPAGEEIVQGGEIDLIVSQGPSPYGY